MTKKDKDKTKTGTTAESKPSLDIQVVQKDEIPKTNRRHSGIYGDTENRLKELKEGEAITFKVATRPTAAGFQKYFKPLGYDVITRAIDEKEGGGVKVYIGKGLKSDIDQA